MLQHELQTWRFGQPGIRAIGFPGHILEEAYKKILETEWIFCLVTSETRRNQENIQKMRALFLPYYQIHNNDFGSYLEF